jgi:tetratricopeptide (TPR) repeat protein
MISTAKRSATCLALCWHVLALCAQENPARLDSIVPLLDPAKKDTTQLRMLIWACESWTTSPKAYPYLQRLDELSAELLEHEQPRIRARARHARGAYHFFTGYHAKFERNVPKALRSFKQAIRDFEVDGHRHAVAQCLDALGLVYELAGASDKAERAFIDELRIGREIGHVGLQNQALVHIADIHAARQGYDLAWTYLDSCGGGTPSDSCMVLNERALIRTQQGRPAEAEELLRNSLVIAARSPNAWDSLPALTPLIRLHHSEGNPREGLELALTCARLAERMGDATAQCGCLNLVGDGYRASGDLRSAAVWYERGMALAERIGNVGVARELGDEGSMLYAANGLKEVYKLQGRTADALRMTERWSVLKDSVQRMNGREEVLSARFMEEALRDSLERDAEDHLEALERMQQQQRDRSRLHAIIVLCLVALLIAFAFWNRARYMRRANAAILIAQQKLV